MERDDDDILVPLRVAAIIDGGTPSSYNLVLKEITGTRRIVMAIGLSEAQSIAVFMEGVTLPRPLAHDLMANIIAEMGGSVSRVIIEELQDGFFRSSVICEQNGRPIFFDARTSDAVALALRCRAAIFVRESILSLVNGGKAAEEKPSTAGLPIECLPTSTLQSLFDEAIENEDYEQAQKLQEEINKRVK